jgi:hypothetical protein
MDAWLITWESPNAQSQSRIAMILPAATLPNR